MCHGHTCLFSPGTCPHAHSLPILEVRRLSLRGQDTGLRSPALSIVALASTGLGKVPEAAGKGPKCLSAPSSVAQTRGGPTVIVGIHLPKNLVCAFLRRGLVLWHLHHGGHHFIYRLQRGTQMRVLRGSRCSWGDWGTGLICTPYPRPRQEERPGCPPAPGPSPAGMFRGFSQ